MLGRLQLSQLTSIWCWVSWGSAWEDQGSGLTVQHLEAVDCGGELDHGVGVWSHGSQHLGDVSWDLASLTQLSRQRLHLVARRDLHISWLSASRRCNDRAHQEYPCEVQPDGWIRSKQA